jgi:drug/metabolite transporter (DMT)-like permease
VNALRREHLALAAAAAVGVQVGSCIAASRWLVQDLGPMSLTFLRYAIGLACLLPFVRGWRPALARLGARDGAALAALGIVQFGVLIALLNVGLRHLDAGLGALIFATFPLLTLAFATLAGHERFDGLLAAGVLVSVAGVAVALGVHPPSQGGARLALGAACVLAAAICGAVCAVLYRPLLRRHAMLPMGALAMAAAVAVLGPAAWAEGLAGRAAALPAAQWVAVVAVGLSSGLSYAAWLWALKHTTSTKATTFLALSPVTAALIGALALGEPLGLGLWLGMLGILAGLMLVAARSPLAPAPIAAP